MISKPFIVKVIIEILLLVPRISIGQGAKAANENFRHEISKEIDEIIPVDIYIPGCPPRPETALDALVKLQEKIQKQEQEWRWKRRK